MLELFRKDRERLQNVGRSAGSALRVHQLLQINPVLSIADAATKLSMSWPGVKKAIAILENEGMVREFTGQRRNRLYSYDAYLDILAEDTEPLPR